MTIKHIIQTRVSLAIKLAILFVVSSCDNTIVECSKSEPFDTTYKYTAVDFESFCKGIEHKKLPRKSLECLFASRFDATADGDFMIYKFILYKHAESLDSCWGIINYQKATEKVESYNVFCQ